MTIPQSYFGIKSIKQKDIKRIDIWVHDCPYCHKTMLFEEEIGDDEQVSCTECGELVFVEG